MGTLYVVGTPIGNLEDISLRALDVLQRAALIASENPQRTLRLLSRYQIQTPMMRYTDAYDRRKQNRMQAILDALAQGDVALVSEAGMPGLADPGYELLALVRQQGIPVQIVPGPTALAAALAVAGIDCERFVFLGFLPRSSGARREVIASMATSSLALVAYESPHRLLDTLAELEALLGDRPMAACSELTKLYEKTRRATPAELLAHFRDHKPRGEFVLVIAPAGRL